MKTSKMAVLAILVTIIVMAVPASAYVSSQSIETKAERMVDIASEARERVTELVAIVEENATAMQLITDAELNEQFYGNLSLCVEQGTMVGGEEATEDGEGWTYLDTANQSLLAEDYEEAIDNAREALEIFHDALRSIKVILYEADVEIGQLLDPQILQEAIGRSLDRVSELRALLADVDMLTKLDDAEELLNEAQDLLELKEIEAAKVSLREANALISEVCQDLKQIAQELNPSRVRGYLDEAYRYRERFRERFGQAGTEGFDVSGFLQTQGYQNEEEFMVRFQEMIENAKGIEDIEDLKEIGRTIREMNDNLTEEVGQYRARHGQAVTGSGYGQNDGGHEGSSGSGQPGFGGGQ